MQATINTVQTLIDLLPFYIWMKDTEGKYIIVNKYFAHACNHRVPSDFPGKTDYDVWPHDLAEKYRYDDAEVMHTKSSKRVDELTQLIDKRLWIETYKTPIIHNGKSIGTVGYAFDITERKNLEEKLVQERTLLQTLIHTIPDLIWLKDKEGVYLSCNERFESFFGAKEEEIVGKTDYDFVDKELADFFRAHDKKAIENDVPSMNEEWITFANDGHKELLETTKTPMKTKTGELIGVLGIGHNSTEKYLAHTELARKEHYKDTLFEISLALINLPLNTIDNTLNSALATMGKYSKADRAYIFTYDFEKNTTSNTYEWCSPGTEPQIDELQSVPLEAIPEWVEAHAAGKEIHIADVDAMASEGLKEILEPQNIQSILTLPLMDEDECIGFIGFDRCHIKEAFGEEDIKLLKLFAVLLVNVHKRKTEQYKLELARHVYENAREGIIITDEHNQIIDVNDAFTAISGYTKEEIISQNPNVLKSGIESEQFYEEMWTEINTRGYWRGEVWNRKKSGDYYAQLTTISSVYDHEQNLQHYIGLFSDITALKEQEAMLKKIAHYDTLTNLPNRVLLSDRLEQAILHSQRRNTILGIIYLDLDGFKEINDAYGHDVGDKMLMGVSENISKVLRESDTFARMGGDEFVIVLQNLTSTNSTLKIMDKVLDAGAKHVTIGEHKLQVTLSLGITFYPQVEEIYPDQLIRQADQAMYFAKQQGKNRYHIFDTEQDKTIRTYHQNITHLENALENKEFLLHYQPKVNMTTGELLGVEALLRWEHPTRGLLYPASFIETMLGHAIEIEIGKWIIQEVIHQIKLWQSQGYEIPISINVTARQLQQEDFIATLLSELKASDIRPSMIELELLESNALTDFKYISSMINLGREKGLRFSLDDFGTGYSSLAYLRYLNVDTLKIDRSFVHDMLEDKDDYNVLKGTIALADTFKRGVLAEGVETEAQGEELIRLGCKGAQGYAIAKPMIPEKILPWYKRWEPFISWKENRNDT